MGRICKFLFSKILRAGLFRFSSLALLCWSAPLWAQPSGPETHLLYRVDHAVRFLAADPLGQVYVVTPQNELLQYNAQGVLAYKYQNFRHGELAWVDAGNPLNILLFYPQFGQVVILDRTLSEIALLNFPEKGLWDVSAIGRSSDNQIWLYDPVQTLIRKITVNGEYLAEGQPLSMLLPETPRPVWILEQKQEVYLYDPIQGVMVFDAFGQYLKTIPADGMEGLRIWDGYWTFWKEGQLFFYQPLAHRAFPIELPEPATTGIFQAGRLILQTEKGFAVYGY